MLGLLRRWLCMELRRPVSDMIRNKTEIVARRNLSNYRHLTGNKKKREDNKFLLVGNPFYFRYELLNIINNNRNNTNDDAGYYRKNSCDELTNVKFEEIVSDTLECLYDRLEEAIDSEHERRSVAHDVDITLSDGILVLKLGDKFGTYVINKQTPNKQIWLSSPSSGPKRYDFRVSRQCWIYHHDGRTMHDLLQQELSEIFPRQSLNLNRCLYSGSNDVVKQE